MNESELPKKENKLSKLRGKLGKTVGETTSSVGSFAGASAANIAGSAARRVRLTFASTGKGNESIFSPSMAAENFERWLRSIRNGDQIETDKILLSAGEENQLYTIQLEEKGLLGNRYLFAFAFEATTEVTSFLIAKEQKFASKVLIVGYWPTLRFSFTEADELSLFVWSDQVKLGKNNAAANYVTDWLVAEKTGSKFEEKTLIEKPSSEMPDISKIIGHSHKQVLTSLEPAILAPHGKAKEGTWLFSIYGQGGVGKSYILKKIKKFYGARILYAKVDHQRVEGNQEINLANLLNEIITQLKDAGCSDKKFKEILHALITHESSKVELDWEEKSNSLSKNSTAMLRQAEQISKTKNRDVKLLKTAQMAAMSVGIIGELYTVFTQIRQERGAILESQAVKELTSALVQTLVQFSKKQENYYLQRRVVLAFDSYEQLKGVCDEWLRTIFLEKLNDTNIDPVILLVGRRKLLQENTRWSEYKDYKKDLKLEGFTRSETYNYLLDNGIKANRKKEIYTFAEGLPLLVDAVVDNSEGETIEVMYKRILEEVPKDWWQRFLDMAVPDGFNLDVLQKVLELNKTPKEIEEANEIFDYLKNATFIENRENHWHYQPSVRKVLLRYGEMRSPTWMADIRERLAK